MKWFRENLVMNTFVPLMVLIVISGCIPSTPPPYNNVQYDNTVSSGNIAYTEGVIESGICYMSCRYQLSTTLLPDYDQVEIFLTGWDAHYIDRATTLQKLSLGVKSSNYDPVTGRFDWEASADIRDNRNAEEKYKRVGPIWGIEHEVVTVIHVQGEIEQHSER